MTKLTAKQTASMLENKDTLLLDVREPAEFAEAHIDQANLAPLSKIGQYTLPENAQKVVVHCAKGIRAQKAIDNLKSRYPNVEFFNFESGIDGWREAGFSLVTHASEKMPLKRQAQLAMGLIILLCIILSATLPKIWFIFAGLLGAVLALSASKQSNIFVLIMAKMPWNQK